MTNRNNKAIAVIPTFNESQNILTLIDKLISIGVHVLVVDDSSPDGTFELIQQHNQFNNNLFGIRRIESRSYAKAVIQGFEYALKNNYTKIIQMDADLSHRIEDLSQMILKDTTDLVIGSRYVKGGEIIGWKNHRRILSKYSNKIAKHVLRTDVNDLTSGFRVYDQKILKEINFKDIESSGYSFLVEILSLVISNKNSILEYPISFIDRANGKSKMSFRIIIESGFNILKLYIKTHKFW